MLLDKLLWVLPRKVTQITRYRMKEEQFASENYQIMNYGIGGRISMHLDSVGKIFLKPCFSIALDQWLCTSPHCLDQSFFSKNGCKLTFDWKS